MSALVLVDVQHDFISGSLAVNGAEEILPVVYKLLDEGNWDLIVASQVGSIAISAPLKGRLATLRRGVSWISI